MAWAFAKADLSDKPLFATLARTAVRLVGKRNTKELANTALAFAMAEL